MYQGHTETQQLKNNNESPKVMVHAGQINKTTTLPITTEEEWRQSTSYNHGLGYIKRIEKQGVFQTLSERTSGAGQWIDVLLCHPAHSQG